MGLLSATRLGAAPTASACLALVLACSAVVPAKADAPGFPEPPKPPDGSVHVSLFAAEPEVVTPIGATVDARGRLLIVESHTHFRPKNYQGPPTDRIRILEDTKGTGKADKFGTFYEGASFLMNLVADRDGSVVVSSRNEIFRLADPEGRGAAGAKTTLAKLQTKSDYPHNGLHGLAVGRDGGVYFGIGENLGGPWTLVGADGASVSDETGSGAVFRTDAQGRGLVRLARGFWNPFGLGFDPAGTLWAVDNDPDGRPPCRLLQIEPGADFGFEFRYGRTGMHPLQAWDAELPGTLGMVAGVGEAPCAVLWHDGRLLVSSWRDHQVQGYALTPRGASYTATMQPVVSGGENFRPVGLAAAPDGSLFVTDWASSSYSVNGKGRVWKLTFARPGNPAPEPKPTEAMRHAEQLRTSEDAAALLAALDDLDPYTAQAAQFGLSRLPAVEKIEWGALKSPSQRIGLLSALMLRGADLRPRVAEALDDRDDRVRQMAVRVVAEQGMTDVRPDLEKRLHSQAMSPRLLAMTVATINQLGGDKAARIDSAKVAGVLLSRMNAPGATDQTRAVALHMMLASHPHVPLDQIRTVLQSPSPALRREAVRYLDDDPDPARFTPLAEVAADAKIDAATRAEAVDGLSDDAATRADLLLQLAAGPDAAVRQEAMRSLRPVAANLTAAQKEKLVQAARQSPADADLARRLLGEAPANRPPESDTAAWQKLLDQQRGDAEAGRRVFFHHAGAGCYRCHAIEGQGRSVGPDLTMIGHSQSREHVLESILDPSREVAPLFTLWTITTRSGQRVDGMLLRRDGQAKEVYADASGQETTVPESEVVDRKVRKESLMPEGLVRAMTDQELRDLLAFLTQKR